MSEHAKPICPECSDDQPTLDRRNFIRVVGGTAAALTLGGVAGLRADEPKPAAKKTPRPAEELIKELFTGLSDDQKKMAVFDFDAKGDPKSVQGGLKRLGMYNASLGEKIGKVYTKPQQELVERILRAIASNEDGFSQLTRNGTYDASQSLDNCGAHIFGDPMTGKYSWVFSGHHLTVRCDGNHSDGVGFGGPMYYGHTPNGYSEKNCFWYQTKRVLEVFDALDEKQRKKAIVKGTPGEQFKSVQHKDNIEEMPGILYVDLSKDQKGLVEAVMRDVLSPYRKEDADEVMQVARTAGLDKMHLAFYDGPLSAEKTPWEFWRLEGPGFVWNYRVLPHVHTFVNISGKV